jgi:uncharacterized protein (TIGR02246 family)
MKSTTLLTSLAFLVLGAHHTHAQSQQGQTAMDHASIQATIDANNQAVAARDMDAILATYEANATMLAQPGMPATGTAALRASFNYFLALNPKITVLNSQVVQSGDIAMHSYTWKMSGKSPDASPVEQSGLSINVLRKQSDGRWLIVIDNPFGENVLNQED